VDDALPAQPAKFHFISGLPRAGSTLLAALLRQNPRFHAGMTSPLADMLNLLIAEMSGKNDFSVAVSDAQRADVLRAVVHGFYRRGGAGDVVFDTSRVWCDRLPTIAALFPDARLIACVREIPWVLDSVERLVRRQPLNVNKIFHFSPALNVYSRAEALTDPKGMVGFCFQATKDAFYSDLAPGRVLLLRYESLVADPLAALRAVYAFIGEPWFTHDFQHVAYDADAFDARLGLPGLHTVKPRVAPPDRPSVLPPDLFRRYVDESFWLDPKRNARGVPVI
jgi:sulfotransferase